MALKLFANPATKWIPQASYSVTVTDNGGAEAMQDVLIRTSDLSTSVIASFARNTRWEDIFPEVPIQYRNLKLKTTDPTDRGDGITILRCSFSGYTLAAPGSSGEEVEQSTSTLTGQLTSEPLSNHPKWQDLSDTEKNTLGQLIRGEWVYIQDPFNAGEFVVAVGNGDGQYVIRSTNDQITSEDGLMFAKIIAEGETTHDRGGWVYSYNTESEQGFTASQLNSLGKIVANPPGNPKKPSSGYVWQLAAPQQTQSGDNRFIKSLDFRLIPDNPKNQFLYGE
jgi:hypothetical protein